MDNDMAWQTRARCRGIDPDLFFPGRDDIVEAELAKAVCIGCPVRDECLEYALDNGIREGVWGGVGERSRRLMRRRRRLAAVQAVAS